MDYRFGFWGSVLRFGFWSSVFEVRFLRFGFKVRFWGLVLRFSFWSSVAGTWLWLIRKMLKDDSNNIWHLGWSFTTSLNHKVVIWWGFFRLSAPTCTGIGAVSLKKPHHIATLWFSEVVNDHPNWSKIDFFFSVRIFWPVSPKLLNIFRMIGYNLAKS